MIKNKNGNILPTPFIKAFDEHSFNELVNQIGQFTYSLYGDFTMQISHSQFQSANGVIHCTAIVIYS